MAVEEVGGVMDSKKTTRAQRVELFKELSKKSHYSVHIATVNDISGLGIYQARNLAVEMAGLCLLKKIRSKGYGWPNKQIIIDGHFAKKWLLHYESTFTVPTICMIGGDSKVYEISAASIVAKVYVDMIFDGMARDYPGYRLDKNHGSPDPEMYEKLRSDGPTPFHRIEGYGKEWWDKIMEGEYVDFGENDSRDPGGKSKRPTQKGLFGEKKDVDDTG
jgi:ribonuclease HII